MTGYGLSPLRTHYYSGNPRALTLEEKNEKIKQKKIWMPERKPKTTVKQKKRFGGTGFSYLVLYFLIYLFALGILIYFSTR